MTDPTGDRRPPPRTGPGFWGWVGRPLVAVAIAGGLGYWIWTSGSPRTPAEPPASAPPEAPAPAAGWAPRARPAPEPRPECPPKAEQRCLDGDVYWYDGCERPHEKAEDCGLRPCRDGACEVDPPNCGGAPIPGRCEDEAAVGCDAGRPYRIDCGALKRRCVLTEEGPACREPSERDCDPRAPTTRCEGATLEVCRDGRWAAFDCLAVGGTCSGNDRDGYRCVTPGWPSKSEECGACGCPPGPRGPEICDGLDNDDDGIVDENADCGTVDILAIVIADDDGNSSYSDEDLAEELERVNRAFARDDDLGLTFRLLGVVRPAMEVWLELQGPEINAVLMSSVTHPPRDGFYIPVIFTDRILMDEVPRPGLATPPNGMCGGQRRTPSPQPGVGAVVVGKRRWPTTVAHEIGHFLGLCHTHSTGEDAVVRVPGPDAADGEVCEEPCAREADGICDTPLDPGPQDCSVDPQCSIHCESGDRPDPANIMAYYPACRSLFTTEQALTMRRSLALRRAWHPCLQGKGCNCKPGEHQCPEQMSCRPYVSGESGDRIWQCGLDGARVPGAQCRGSGDCSHESICVSGPSGAKRCTRPCTLLTPDCDCVEQQTLGASLCVDDLG